MSKAFFGTWMQLTAKLRTPETFDIVAKTVDVAARKNLSQISRMLTQITSGQEFGDDSPYYLPVNEYVRKAIGEVTAWLFEGMITYNSSSSST